MLEFVVNGQRLMPANEIGVVADTINYIEMGFEFDEDWSDVIPWAELVSPDGKKITPIIDTEVRGNHGLIPEKRGINLTEGVWTLSLIGDRYSEGECVKRITTNAVTITVSASGITDGEPFVIDIDAGTEIIARAASFAEIAEGKVAEAEEKIRATQAQIEEAKQMIHDAEGIAEQAAKDAKTAMDAAKSVPAAVRNAGLATIEATNAATNARTAAGKAQDIYAAVKAALESGSFDGEDGFSPTVQAYRDGKTVTVIITDKNGKHGFAIHDGEDGQGADVTADAIAQALGFTPADSKVVSKQGESIVDLQNEAKTAIRYTEQALTDSQKAQAKTNIDASRITDIVLFRTWSKATFATYSVQGCSEKWSLGDTFPAIVGDIITLKATLSDCDNTVAFMLIQITEIVNAYTVRGTTLIATTQTYGAKQELTAPNTAWTDEQRAVACDTIGARLAIPYEKIRTFTVEDERSQIDFDNLNLKEAYVVYEAPALQAVVAYVRFDNQSNKSMGTFYTCGANASAPSVTVAGCNIGGCGVGDAWSSSSFNPNNQDYSAEYHTLKPSILKNIWESESIKRVLFYSYNGSKFAIGTTVTLYGLPV